MNISEAMSLCHKNDVHISGGKVGVYFYVYINDKMVEKKPLASNKELNKAIVKTYFYKAKKLLSRLPTQFHELGEESTE